MKIYAFSKTYEGIKAVDFPDMELEKGKIYAVLGANGSGKSTFAKILSKILPSDQKKTATDCTNIGYLPQKSYGFRMSVKKNLLLNGSNQTCAKQLLKTLQLEELEEKRADKLSGGETARMALARLLMKRYDVLILDEPTAAMDIETTLIAEKVLREYAKQTNCTLILITHSLQQARRMADEVIFFHKGLPKEIGTKEILHQANTKELQQFLDFYGI